MFIYVYPYPAEKEKTRVSLLSDFSLKISPVEESDFGVIHCEQHVLTQTYPKRYRLRRGKTKRRDLTYLIIDYLIHLFFPIRCSLK